MKTLYSCSFLSPCTERFSEFFLSLSRSNLQYNNRQRIEISQTLQFLDPEGGSQKATLVVLVLVVLVIRSLKIPKVLLIRSEEQRNFAYTFVLIFATDLPSQIFS